MIYEFDTLLEKTRQLAALSQSLRAENAELRAALSLLTAEKSQLSGRINEAHTRLAILLETMPAAMANEKSA